MPRILVVEDDPEIARVIVAKLREHDHDVLHLHNGRDALARIREERFDAITLDRMLPGMDGLELIGRLRAAQIMTATPATIMAAASVSPTLAIRAARQSIWRFNCLPVVFIKPLMSWRMLASVLGENIASNSSTVNWFVMAVSAFRG